VIVERIKDTRTPFYRPPLPQQESEGVHPGILTLMKQCWAEEPSERPSFVEVAKTIRIINKGKSVCLHSYNMLYSVIWTNKQSSSSSAVSISSFVQLFIFVWVWAKEYNLLFSFRLHWRIFCCDMVLRQQFVFFSILLRMFVRRHNCLYILQWTCRK